jgi:hypothetical protein
MTTEISARRSSLQPILGISVPDTKLVWQIREFVHDRETELLFNHSSRVYYFAAIAGEQHALRFDAELLYAGAMSAMSKRTCSRTKIQNSHASISAI